MRKVRLSQIMVFALLITVIAVSATVVDLLALDWIELGDFRGVVLVGGWLVIFQLCSLVVYRLWFWIFPVRTGAIPPGSSQEFAYHVCLLFHLIIFHPINRSGFFWVPLKRLYIQALGAKLGANTYSSGIIVDPHFVEIGANTLIGQSALICPHAIENEHLSHERIRIGSNVTIGTHAVILPGVTIGDRALVAAGSVVPKGTRIGPGENWGGVPARRISTSADEAASSGSVPPAD